MKTVRYDHAHALDLDVFTSDVSNPGSKPAVVFFHGGGMVAGSRKSLFFQKWLLGM